MSEFRHPDHRASAEEWIGRGLGSGNPDDMAHPDDPAREAIEHAQRVGDITLLVRTWGQHAVIEEKWKWAPGKWWPVAVEPEPEPLPPPPPGPEPPSGFDVVLEPDQGNWQSRVIAAGDGASIGFAPGVYVQFSVSPRPGQTFGVLEGADVVLRGDGVALHAFRSPVPSVVIDGRAGTLIVEGYNTPNYLGAISNLPASWYENVPAASRRDGWKVRGVTVRRCNYGVTLIGGGAELTDFTIKDCDTIGFKILWGHDDLEQLVARGDVIGNGLRNKHKDGWGHEGGGSKSWESRNLTHRDLLVMGNRGPGLWTDHGNQNVVYENLTLNDNSAVGVFHEISGWADIRNVVVEDQGSRPAGSGWGNRFQGGGIVVANAKARISDVVIRRCKVGIVFCDQNRGAYTHTTEGTVTGAEIIDSGFSGFGTDSGAPNRTAWSEMTYRDGSFGP